MPKEMEESIEASMNRDLHSASITSSSSYSSEEESGWTIYFEEFIASQKMQIVAMEEEKHTSSKVVSDASSHAALIKEATSVRCKRLRLKKRKAMGISFIDDEDALEDTASSPVNSPKVSGMDDSPKDDVGGISEEKGFDSEKCGELKKRGLCLVPLSMFLDFHGH